MSCGTPLRFYFEDDSPDDFRDLRDDGVAEGSKTVHPSGNPMSHSTHVGFNEPPTVAARFGLPRMNCFGVLSRCEAVGVGSIFT